MYRVLAVERHNGRLPFPIEGLYRFTYRGRSTVYNGSPRGHSSPVLRVQVLGLMPEVLLDGFRRAEVAPSVLGYGHASPERTALEATESSVRVIVADFQKQD
jgi:hypothetical protein